MKVSTPKIRPCPCCRDDQSIKTIEQTSLDGSWCRIACDACGASGPECDSLYRAIHWWNSLWFTGKHPRRFR